MNKDFLNQIPADEQPVAKKLQSVAENLQVSSTFQAKLESQLRETHNEKMAFARNWQMKILPSLGWAILIVGAVFILNWAVRSLMSGQEPATSGTPEPNISFEENIKTGNICQGQLTVMHGYSVFLSNRDRGGFKKLGEGMDIGELRDFAWSPDGSQLAVVGNTRGSGNIYLTDATGTQLQPVLPNSELGYLLGVSWSHDGEQLLTWEINNNTRLYLLNKDSTGLTEIDLPLQFFETPQFAPDNESVLFYGADASADGLFQVSIDGSQVRKLSDMVGSETSFTWSPDRSRLAYIEMESDSPNAHIVIDSGQENTSPEIHPIDTGTGSSIRDSANLSWAPDGKSLAFGLIRNGAGDLVNVSYLEGGSWWTEGHAPAISADGRCLAYIKNNHVYVFDLMAAASSSPVTPNEVVLVDLPDGRTRADIRLDKLQWTPGTITVPDIPDQIDVIPTPSGTEYDWRGMKLYLDASLPPAPAQVGLYEAQLDRHATLDSARALAQQFGLHGQIYETPSELGDNDMADFLVVDGNQRLQIRSNLYFSYYPDYPRWNKTVAGQKPDSATAENLIKDFLRSHGFDFDYKVEDAGFYDGYYALPLTPEELPVRHNHFSAAGFLFRFDQDEILAVEASLVTYSPVDNFEVISAEEALQKLLNPNSTAGLIEGGHSINEPIQAWYRPRPENKTITVWGWVDSFKSAEGGAPLITFDGYQAIGNIDGLVDVPPNTFIEASGQFQNVGGIKAFNIENWQVYEGGIDGIWGTIHREGNKVVITTSENLTLTLPDISADLPLPMENAFVEGIIRADTFEVEWESIDTRMQGSGGGGGGGGSGFYRPNLTGTPVPLPTAQPQEEANTGTSEYIVQDGDTLSGIAETHEITVDELMQANGLNETTIFVGQTLLIPGTQEETSLVGQKLDGQRGTLTVTIINKQDGSQSVDYRLQVENREIQYQLMRLEGVGLNELQTRNNLPIDIWGTVERYDTDLGMRIPVVNVERYEIPYPDLQYQIFKGTQSLTTVQGDTITLFTTEDGQIYAQANGYGDLIGNEGDQILLEALVLPDGKIAGYPVLQVVSASMAINPKSGEPIEMEASANQPYVIDEAEFPEREIPAELTATIESVELVYFTPNQRYTVPDPAAEPVYIQPAWHFQGHYWDGSEFEILVQALKDEFLLPEIDRVEPPG